MKRIIFFLSLLCATQYVLAQEVKITGKITNYMVQSNDSITLQINRSMSNPIILKSAISKKGAFSFAYTENSTNYCELYISSNDRIPMFLSSGENVSISADASSLNTTAIVSGSEETSSMQKNIRTIQAYMTEAQNIKLICDAKIDSLEKKKNEQIAESIRHNPYLLSNLSIISILPIETYSSVYQLLDSSLQSAYPNNEFVDAFHQEIQKLMVLRVGSTMNDIILADENGKMHSLESLRGKVVLIDFWASWCRPCRMEIPNFKKLYDAYHQSGFDIYSISVDNDAMAWKKALEQEQMPWTNVHDDKKIYSNMYNVSSIPFTILIDKDGKIVGKGLRGQDLSSTVIRTLNK